MIERYRRQVILAMAAIVVVGFLSGVVGELWLNGFLLPDPYLNFKNYSDLSSRLDELIGRRGGNANLNGPDAAAEKAIGLARPTVVGIYRFKHLTDKASATLTAADFVASGALVTSDGWLVTDRRAVNGENDAFWVVGGGAIHRSEKVLIDAGAGIAMIKIKADNLAVADFVSRDDLVFGQTVYVFGRGQRVVAAQIKDKSFAKSGAADLLRGSQQFYKFIQLSGALSKEFIGSPVMSATGRMAGVLADENGLVIPVDHFVGAMKAALDGKKWARPYLGIKFFDLSEILNPAIEEKRGALISAGGILDDSPAKGVLSPGDIILKMENEELTVNKNLSDIMAQYSAGQTVKLTVKRGKDTVEASVVLK